jgi:hypothetical protein
MRRIPDHLDAHTTHERHVPLGRGRFKQARTVVLAECAKVSPTIGRSRLFGVLVGLAIARDGRFPVVGFTIVPTRQVTLERLETFREPDGRQALVEVHSLKDRAQRRSTESAACCRHERLVRWPSGGPHQDRWYMKVTISCRWLSNSGSNDPVLILLRTIATVEASTRKTSAVAWRSVAGRHAVTEE